MAGPIFSRDQLTAPKTQEVHLEGGSVIIRMLTAGEAMEYRGKQMGAEEIFGMLALSIYDPKMTVEDVREIPVTVVSEIVTAVFTFNALGQKAVKEAIDELKKTTNEDLPVNSP